MLSIKEEVRLESADHVYGSKIATGDEEEEIEGEFHVPYDEGGYVV